MIFLQSEKLNISYWESLLEINSLKLCLSENLLFSFLLLKDNFSGYRIVYFPVNSLNISLQSLLACLVCEENSDVILILDAL